MTLRLTVDCNIGMLHGLHDLKAQTMPPLRACHGNENAIQGIGLNRSDGRAHATTFAAEVESLPTPAI